MDIRQGGAPNRMDAQSDEAGRVRQRPRFAYARSSGMRKQASRALPLFALALTACSGAPAAAPAIAVVKPPSSAIAMPIRNEPPASALERAEPAGPFMFRKERPEDALGSYATRYWGGGGMAVFGSPASVSEGDVTGDSSPARLIEVGQYAVVDLPDRGGCFIRDLGEAGWVTSLEASDVTGVGRDVILHYTLRDPHEKTDGVKNITSVTHFVMEVWSFRGTSPRRLFAHEHEAWANCCGSELGPAPPRVSDVVEIRKGEITIRAGTAYRATAGTFHPRPLDGIPALLTPWGDVQSRVFAWNGSEFASTRESR